MKYLLAVSATVLAISALAPRVHAQGPGVESPEVLRSRPIEPVARVDQRPLPRLKLSLVRFEAGHPSGGTIGLQSLHLDMYALSWKYARVGVGLEGGLGRTKLAGAGTALKYGLFGLTAGVQYPGRITPFVEGGLAAGVIAGTLNEPLMIPGTSISASGLTAATWMLATSLDVGAEVYTFGRAYVSVAVGWIRTGWRGADYSAASGLTFKDVKHDSFMLKAGLGF